MEVVKNEKKRRKLINHKRYINVIFADGICNKIMVRGALCTTKDELTNSLKTDELLFQDIANKYNIKEKHNNSHHYNTLCFTDPHHNQPINCQETGKEFKSMEKEYVKGVSRESKSLGIMET